MMMVTQHVDNNGMQQRLCASMSRQQKKKMKLLSAIPIVNCNHALVSIRCRSPRECTRLDLRAIAYDAKLLPHPSSSLTVRRGIETQLTSVICRKGKDKMLTLKV